LLAFIILLDSGLSTLDQEIIAVQSQKESY
jgi:hypothetical protein